MWFPEVVRFISRSLCNDACIFAAAIILCGTGCFASAQTAPSAERIADSILQSSAQIYGNWTADIGMQLEGLDAAWYNTANGNYFRFEKAKVDALLAANTLNGAAGTDDSALFGHQLLLLYRVTLDAKYYKAASAIHARLAATCDSTSASAGKVCTAEPFMAEYASVFQEPQEFAKITQAFERWDRSTHWPSANKQQVKVSLQDNSVAWLAASIVDALSYYPQDEPGRASLIAMLSRIADTARQHQNASTALFEKSSDATVHQPIAPSQACLLAYALAKGARLSDLPAKDSTVAVKAWQAIARTYLSANSDSVPVPGLGFLLITAAELNLAPTATLARGQTVLLDAWYNSQQRKNAAGQMESFHYKWSDMSDSGYALFGHMFRSYGAATETLSSAPTRETLNRAQYYIIVSPDIPVKNPFPHYMTEQDAAEIAAWVKDGGVLILLENDPPNADLTHLNLLADRFGIHFDDVLHHHIVGEHVEDGRMPVEAKGPLFHHPHTLYMKDTCALSLSGPAVELFHDRGDVVMASAKFGRGTVFAAVDPWLYNEYTDGRKKPEIYDQFDNFAGGRELVQWLLQQHPE